VGYKSIVAGHDANNSLSEHKKTEIRNKALYIVASLSHLMSNGDVTIWPLKYQERPWWREFADIMNGIDATAHQCQCYIASVLRPREPQVIVTYYSVCIKNSGCSDIYRNVLLQYSRSYLYVNRHLPELELYSTINAIFVRTSFACGPSGK
jgi:hypothetical protein